MNINLIYAQARNGVIGRDNQLPWHLPEDLAHFKQLTLGGIVLMGRKTWDSLPANFRPLPGRTNVVLSRTPHWSAPGAQVFHDLPSALAHFSTAHDAQPSSPEVWVIGGAQIYAQVLPLAQRVEVTYIDADFEGDAYAPTLDASWTECARQDHISRTGLPFSWISYRKHGSLPVSGG